MKSTDKYNHFFGPSGCVTESALFKYLNHELNTSEMHAIESHLSECLFCSDAMEGYEKQTDKGVIQNDFEAIKSGFIIKQKTAGEFKKKDNKRFLVFAVSIAASLAVIISGYYLFQILPSNDKMSEIALQTPTNKQDIPTAQSHQGPKSESLQEEEATKSTIKGQRELMKETEKETNNDKVSKYYDKGEGWIESDGDAVTSTKATGKSGEYKSIVKAETITTQEQKAGDGIAVTEDLEASGQKDDATLSLDQNKAISKPSVALETKDIVDEIFSVNDVRVEEKGVLGKKDKGKDKNRNQKESVAVTGGVMRSAETPTLNGAIADYNSGYFDQALPQFEYLSEREKNNHAAVYYLAMCLYNKGEKDSALVQIEKLVTKNDNPFYELALWQKARIVEESKDTKQAIELYREIIKNNGTMKTNAIKKVDELDK